MARVTEARTRSRICRPLLRRFDTTRVDSLAFTVKLVGYFGHLTISVQVWLLSTKCSPNGGARGPLPH